VRHAGTSTADEEDGVNDGTRTRDIRHHKPALYQLSYAHHAPDVAIGPAEV
jgi:hypothetical protein